MDKDSSLIDPPSPLSLKAPAKINWFLNILGLRDDGFHEIQSLMQKITLYDELSFFPSDKLLLKTDTDIPVEQNLVYKAAKLLQKTYGIKNGASISLKKNIPAGAGLGGGSSDAASTLSGLNALWSMDLSREDLCKIAEQLGSDVPFFLYNSISFSYGRGEKITPCRADNKANLLLVKPPLHVSTAWAYGESRSKLTKKADKVDNIKFLIQSIERTDFKNIADIVSNDLEPVTIGRFPVISEIKESLKQQGAIFSLMSGSGSAVFGIFNSAEDAENASKAFKGYWTAVVQTITE